MPLKDRRVQDKNNGRNREELSPDWVKREGGYIFLTLEVKEISQTTHAQKSSSEVKRERASPHVSDSNLPIGLSARTHLG